MVIITKIITSIEVVGKPVGDLIKDDVPMDSDVNMTTGVYFVANEDMVHTHVEK